MGSLPKTSNDKSEAEAVLGTIRELLSEYDSKGSYDRLQLKNAAERLSIGLETPGDTTQRIAYYPVRTTVVRIGNQLNLFRILADSPVSLSSIELAKRVGADHGLLQRILRYLVSMYAIGEAGKDLYFATNITRNLTVPGLEAGIKHTYDTVGPAVMATPAFLARTNYRNPSDPRKCPFQDAFPTTEALFEWFPKHPEKLGYFNSWMTAQRDGRANWLDFFPFEQQIARGITSSVDDEAVLFVDMGGARGHEIQAIKSHYPQLPGKVILQDLPDTIAQALPVPGLIAMAHDFFTEQTVKEILSQVAKAMKPGYSKILLNEMVVPDQGAEIVATQVDMIMMATLAACERTESHWRKLIEEAGLRIDRIWTETSDAESVIEVVLE
ncbi:uncharacterized protein KY384_003610 [Bacidia gigantensis]|uniref:uncharacterized protein n=1 Tax=Bacidia gigantensis TaxID=2732470 RepID=UPI001D038226|nr:uncharacterized protein KY384_003610 [Bacidia gigantensis]KAG8531974.1 hypothetical protein KY384_003610 [Bacidia gigantensis]